MRFIHVVALFLCVYSLSGCVTGSDGRKVLHPAAACAAEELIRDVMVGLQHLGEVATAGTVTDTAAWKAFGIGLAATRGPEVAKCLLAAAYDQLLASASNGSPAARALAPEASSSGNTRLAMEAAQWLISHPQVWARR
jgi:hypothetical protein